MILKKNSWKERGRKKRKITLKPSVYAGGLFLAALIISASSFAGGCAYRNRLYSENAEYSVTESDQIINSVSARISQAEKEAERDKLAHARQSCDLALEELLSARDKLSDRQYEQLHGRIAMARVRMNHSGKSKISVVESDLFPLVWNSRVEKWINYYSAGNGKKYFAGWAQRAGFYIDSVRDILAEEGLPLDLAYVPVIESGYYPFAKSGAGATGLWQFMEGTGKEYGLKIDYWKDERRDPFKATRSAASMLKGLRERFGSWEMALAAYNYGSNGVAGRIRRWETDDYWELYLPRETEDFVPKVMAAIFILKEPELFGMDLPDTASHRWKEHTVPAAVDLRDVAEWAGVSVKDIQMLNPELKQMCTPPGEEYILRIPENSYENFIKTYAALEESDLYLTGAEIDKRIRRVIYYRVRPGDNLWKISRRYSVSMRDIKKWNNLSSDRIYPRQKLKIYRRGT
ncbi:MAG: transglycosylase SLT domain-containing protein [Elusimicrobiota bacterium]|nr:transglycosylase SLT domain-containing protein [Elusimicrobiota bacterium]